MATAPQPFFAAALTISSTVCDPSVNFEWVWKSALIQVPRPAHSIAVVIRAGDCAVPNVHAHPASMAAMAARDSRGCARRARGELTSLAGASLAAPGHRNVVPVWGPV